MRSAARLDPRSLVSLVAASAFSEETERYRLEKSATGYVRMDTQTGAMSICEERSGQLVCKMAADERAAFQDEIDRLQSSLEALDERVAKLETRLSARLESTAAQRGGIQQDDELHGEASCAASWTSSRIWTRTAARTAPSPIRKRPDSQPDAARPLISASCAAQKIRRTPCSLKTAEYRRISFGVRQRSRQSALGFGEGYLPTGLHVRHRRRPSAFPRRAERGACRHRRRRRHSRGRRFRERQGAGRSQ